MQASQTSQARLRGVRRRAYLPTCGQIRSILSQTFALLQSVTYSIRASLDHTWCKHLMSPYVNTPPFEVCFPTAFPTQRSLASQPHSHVTEACALRVSHPLDALLPAEPTRAYFIPNPLLGFSLRGFLPHPKPYVLPNAASLMTFSTRSTEVSRAYVFRA
jgi:hypothetical protein